MGGTIFHSDLETCERLAILPLQSHVVADNVALPGAPLLLWRFARSPSWRLTAYAMTEFFEANTEDWVAVGSYTGVGLNYKDVVDPPVSWQRLSWHTDHMRRRASGLRPAEGDMFEEDRVAYSRYVRQHYLAEGIQAIP